MDGLIMDYQLTLNAILERAETIFGSKHVVSRLPDRSIHRYTYADLGRRARELAVALTKLGIRPGDRVATFAWNHYQHLEAYFGVPSIGAIVHPLNLRLHPDDIAYIINHAEDRIVLVDQVLLPTFERVLPHVTLEHVIVINQGGPVPAGTLSYEELLAAADPADFVAPEIDERQAALMCYTSGTTGRPKGVLYSHRALVLDVMAVVTPDAISLSEHDIVLAVVPMFHAQCWGVPYACALVGATQLHPGSFLDAESLLSLMAAERVTFAAGVPTIWLGLLQYLEQHPDQFDLSALTRTAVGGQAVPPSMIRDFKERHDVDVIQAWGMTETGPLGSIAYVPSQALNEPVAVQRSYLSKAGRPSPFIELRLRQDDDTFAPWDGETMGEIEIRGAWVSSSYYHDPDGAEKFTEDGWLRTGDIGVIDSLGYLELKDRAKDVIKSGGEWISSVLLENALMEHPAVAEVAVFAAAHPKWLERPVAAVVLKAGASTTETELRAFIAPQVASWWLPDAVLFVSEIPHTSTGKYMKRTLREQHGQILVDRLANPLAGVATDD